MIRFHQRSTAPLAALWLLAAAVFAQDARTTPREPVHPRRNVEEFAPVEAKVVRFSILETISGEPCLDELEIYGPDAPSRNLALAENGTVARASGVLPEYRIHALRHVNDGVYGNGHSWIASTKGTGWVELALPASLRINRVVWSRDREGKFVDRLATKYRVEIATEPGVWQTVSTSNDRLAPLMLEPNNPAYFGSIGRISPTSTELPGAARPAARDYVLESWQTSRGLPANTVTSILQTRDGWLWIGTSNGVARFDGVRFSAFGESHGLPSLKVSCMAEDRDGTLWVGTEGGGLARWDGIRFHAMATGDGRAGNTVLALAASADGALWIGTLSGLFEYRNGRLTPRHDGVVSSMAVDDEGLWLISGGSSVRRWDGESIVLPPENLDRSLFSSASAVAVGPDGAMWFGGANGYVGKLADDAVATFGEGDALLTSSTWELLPTRSADVWVGTSANGLGRLRGKALLQFTTDDGLPSNSVRAICEDREGNIWVGTAGGGLTRIRPRRIKALTTRDGLSHNGIMAMAADARGTVWIGTNGGGLNRWQAEKVEPHSPNYVLENKIISAIAAPPDGSLWLGTSDSGIFRVEDGKAEHLRADEGLLGSVIAALCTDATGGVWVGTLDAGPAYYSAGEFSRPPGLDALRDSAVTTIIEDHAGRIWLGTAGQGIAQLDAGKLTRWTRDDGLASQFVRTLHEDSDGAIWIGTSSGLSRWKSGRLFTFTPAHGLPDAVVSQILDENGHLWLGTNRGIQRVPLASLDSVAEGRASKLDVLSLNESDGLPSLECTGGYHPAGLRLSDGRLCFGTVAGLAVIDPKTYAVASPKPPVVIEEISIGAADAIVRGATALTVPADAGRLEFRFTALAFTAPERLRFRHRMHGLESAWVDIGAARTASYTHLPPGDYRFDVQASADGDAWSDAGAGIALRVLAPWWREPWAYAAGALLALGGVAGVARFFTRRRMQRKMRALEQEFTLERERSRIARDIHDDLGANLTQIGMLSAMGREKRDQPRVVDEQFAAISSTTNELVQSLDAIVWAVNPRHDTLESLARYITRFAGDFCAHSQTRLRLDVPPQLPDVTLSSEVRHNLFLAAKESLNNALRHAAATEIRIRIAAQPDHFSLSIEDDGRGFTPLPDDDGNGLRNMQRRLADCGGSCEIASAAGRGTTVLFTIPLPFCK